MVGSDFKTFTFQHSTLSGLQVQLIRRSNITIHDSGNQDNEYIFIYFLQLFQVFNFIMQLGKYIKLIVTYCHCINMINEKICCWTVATEKFQKPVFFKRRKIVYFFHRFFFACAGAHGLTMAKLLVIEYFKYDFNSNHL